MGADLILAVCEMQLTKTEARKKAKQMVKDNLAEVIALLDNWGVGPWLETGSIYTKKEVAAYLDEQIEITYNYMNRRDCQPLYLNGKTFAVTGGMSWGDTPTDAYDALSVCSALSLTEESKE